MKISWPATLALIFSASFDIFFNSFSFFSAKKSPEVLYNSLYWDLTPCQQSSDLFGNQKSPFSYGSVSRILFLHIYYHEGCSRLIANLKFRHFFIIYKLLFWIVGWYIFFSSVKILGPNTILNVGLALYSTEFLDPGNSNFFIKLLYYLKVNRSIFIIQGTWRILGNVSVLKYLVLLSLMYSWILMTKDATLDWFLGWYIVPWFNFPLMSNQPNLIVRVCYFFISLLLFYISIRVLM